MTELMQSDLHKIIVSPQSLSVDHIKVFLYQILRGEIFKYYFICMIFFLPCVMALFTNSVLFHLNSYKYQVEHA